MHIQVQFMAFVSSMLYQMSIAAASLVTSCPVSETPVDPTAVLKGKIIDCHSESLWRRLLAMNGSYKTV